MFVGQMVSPPHPNVTGGSVTSSTSFTATPYYDKPPASPMDTSDNNINNHSVSSTNTGITCTKEERLKMGFQLCVPFYNYLMFIVSIILGPMSRNTSVINIVHTSTPNKSPGTSGLPIAHSKSHLSQQQQQSTHSKSTPASGQQPDQNNVNKNIVADEATKNR